MDINTSINYTNKNTIKTDDLCSYPLIIIKEFLLFFFTEYKNEWK